MLELPWIFYLFLPAVLGSDNNLVNSDKQKDPRFLLPLFDLKRYEARPTSLGPIHPPAPRGRCSDRLETALEQLKKRTNPKRKTLESQSHLIDLSGYSLYQHLRTTPADMYVTRMRVRLPQDNNWVRVEKCFFDPRNTSLDTMLLFHDITISGNVDLYNPNELETSIGDGHRRHSRSYEHNNPIDYPNDRPYDRGQGHKGCNMILRLRKAGIGFHTRPSNQSPGKFNIKTDSQFVEPGFISVYAYGCEKYVNRNGNYGRDYQSDEPLRRKKRSDEFTFDPYLETDMGRSSGRDRLDNYESLPNNRNNYERSKLFRPDDVLDEAEEISREMEDIFTKGIRTLLTTYMKKELQPAIKETLMRNMGYVISYG